MTKLKLVQLSEPLFLAGVNFGTKIQPRTGKGDVTIEWDEKFDHVIITFNGEVARIKHYASINYRVDNKEVETITQVSHAQIAYPVTAQIGGPGDVLKQRTAQVSTPLDKVQGKPSTTKKAKYQGETQGE